MSQLQSILGGLLANDNTTRSNAETAYGSLLESNPIQCITNLLEILGNLNGDVGLRSMAGILARQGLVRYTKDMPSDALLRFRNILLDLWSSELSNSNTSIVIKRISHCIAQSAASYQWSDLISIILNQIQSSEADDKRILSALELLELVVEYCPDDVVPNIQVLGGFLAINLSSANSNINVVCARLTSSCISVIEDNNIRNSFKAALSPIIAVINSTLSRGDEHEANSIMEHLITVAEMQPLFFKGMLDEFVTPLITIAGDDSLQFSTRSTALEIIVTLTEAAPAMTRRCTKLVQGLVPIAMSLSLEIDIEDSIWAQGKYGEDDEEQDYLIGEQAIERAAIGMGGRVLAPVVLQLAQEASASSEWRRRRAAITSIVRLAEGSPEVFKIHVPAALNFMEAALGDPSPWVCYESVQAVGQFALLFAENNYKVMLNRFLPLLIRGLKSENTSARVRGHCANAIINFVKNDHCDSDLLEPHLYSLLEGLCATLQNSTIEVQGPCLILVGQVALSAEEAFNPFYNEFMPGVKDILRSNCGPGHEELQGKAMQCAGLMGEAVGESIFATDALEIMQILIGALEKSQLKHMGNDSMSFEYILPACASISKALGEKFEPFLHFVMGPILAAATQTIDLQMEDATAEEANTEGQHDEDTGIDSAVINFGGGIYKRVSMNTYAVQQKKSAASLLFEYASNMKGHLSAYLGNSLDALLPMVTDKHSADIRSSASMGIARVFEAAIDAHKKGKPSKLQLPQVLEASLTCLITGLIGENNIEARAAGAEAVRDILQTCFDSATELPDGSRDSSTIICFPNLDQAKQLTNELLKLSKDSLGRRAEKEEAFNSSEVLEDEDRGIFEEEIEFEEELLTNLVDAMGQLIKLHGENFMETFNHVVAPHFLQYIQSNQPKSLQVVAVCMLDDAIEFGGRGMHQYLDGSLPQFLSNLTQDDSVLRQSSAYGIAQICSKAPEYAVNHMDHIVKGLLDLIHAPTSSDEENEGATENAIFALGCLLRSSCPSVQFGAEVWSRLPAPLSRQVIGREWLSALPLTADEMEAKLAHHQLCDSIEAMDIDIVGENMSYLPKILSALAGICSKHSITVATPATIQRVKNVVQSIKSMVPIDNFNTAISQLTPKLQNLLMA